MSLTHLPPGVLPESVMRLWYVQGASYSFQRVTHRTGRWYLPALKAYGELGVDLFFSQSQAMAVAEARIAELARAAGETVAQYVERMKAERDPARVAGRVKVAPFVAITRESLGLGK